MSFGTFTNSFSLRKAIWLAAAVAFTFAALVSYLHPQRVGDGSEYYAMYGEIIHGHRTFMTSEGWDAYEKLVHKGRIAYMVSQDTLSHTFPSLIQKSGSDFNHFWMYSGLAAISGGWTLFVHSKAHMGFMILHALLLAYLVFVAVRSFGWPGCIATVALIAGSPLLWFVDKVHTEFFTFCCIGLASILTFKARHFASAAWLALASTQNISIGASAAFILATALWKARGQGLKLQQMGVTAFTLALIAIHPLYYFFRVGVVDPQLLAGGAKIGANISTIYIWFFDPDVGLFPNWPLGLIFVACIAIAVGRRQLRLPSSFVGLILVFLSTNLYAQSSTENLNSGATIDVARYGLWYIGLLLPLLAALLNPTKAQGDHQPNSVSKVYMASTLLVATLTLASVAYGCQQFNPVRPEHYLEPTALSRWIQEKHPTWYTPPDQIFIMRNAGNQVLPPSYAVAGPGCRKFIVIVRGNAPVQPVAKDWCGLDLTRLPKAIFHPTGPGRPGPDHSRAYTVIVSSSDLKNGKPRFELDHEYSLSAYSIDSSMLLDRGWNQREAWGVWSNGSVSVLSGLAPKCLTQSIAADFEINPFLTEKSPVIGVTASINGAIYGKYKLTEIRSTSLKFSVPCSAITKSNTLEILFQISGATSPMIAYGSSDTRVLGIGLKRFVLKESTFKTEKSEKSFIQQAGKN